MNQELFTAILGGLGAMLGWGISDFFAKKAIDKAGDIKSLFWIQFFGFPLILIYFFFNFSKPIVSIPSVLTMTVFGISYTVVYLLYYKAFKKGQASIVSPVFASYSAFTIIISFLFFGEQIPNMRWILLGTIFAGVILTAIDFKGLKDASLDKEDIIKGLPETLLGVAIFSIWYPLWDKYVSNGNWLFLTLGVRLVMILTAFFYAKNKTVLKIKNRKLQQWLILSGLLDGLGFISLNWALGSSPFTSVTTMTSGAYSLPTLILARIFLKEKLTKIQWIGVFTIIAGLIFISAS